MYGSKTIRISFVCQINLHTSITIYSMMSMIDFLDLCFHCFFLCKIFCFSLFSIIIISIWVNMKSIQQPTDAKFCLVLLNKSISLSSISFAKNAAAFFKKRFSFLSSSSSLRRRRFSFIISNSVVSSGWS